MTETEKVELAIKHLHNFSTDANTLMMLKCIASSLAKIADNMEESKKKEEDNSFGGLYRDQRRDS